MYIKIQNVLFIRSAFSKIGRENVLFITSNFQAEMKGDRTSPIKYCLLVSNSLNGWRLQESVVPSSYKKSKLTIVK